MMGLIQDNYNCRYSRQVLSSKRVVLDRGMRDIEENFRVS